MVQEKDAAKKRQREREDFLRREKERMDAEIIGTRWYVEEYTPEYDYGDGWSRPIPAKQVKVSPYFDTKAEAEEWMDRHEADKGSRLIIRKQNKRRKVTIGWYNH